MKTLLNGCLLLTYTAVLSAGFLTAIVLVIRRCAAAY